MSFLDCKLCKIEAEFICFNFSGQHLHLLILCGKTIKSSMSNKNSLKNDAYGIGAIMKHNSCALKNNRVCYEIEFPQRAPHDCRLLIIEFYGYLCSEQWCSWGPEELLLCNHVEFWLSAIINSSLTMYLKMSFWLNIFIGHLL